MSRKEMRKEGECLLERIILAKDWQVGWREDTPPPPGYGWETMIQICLYSLSVYKTEKLTAL